MLTWKVMLPVTPAPTEAITAVTRLSVVTPKS